MTKEQQAVKRNGDNLSPVENAAFKEGEQGMSKEQQDQFENTFRNWLDAQRNSDIPARRIVNHMFRSEPMLMAYGACIVEAGWQARTPEIEALRAEVLALQERLEITHCYDGDGSRVEIPDGERKDFPDGIYCRDQTIRLLEESNEALRAKLREYEGKLASKAKGE